MKNISYIELMKRISIGEEFLIYYKGRSYWISQSNGSILLTLDENNSQIFPNLQEFVLRAQMDDGNLLTDVIDEVY